MASNLPKYASLTTCCHLPQDDAEPERRELDMYKFTAPAGVRNRTWWTVDAVAPEPDPVVDAQMERAFTILTTIVGMRLLAVSGGMV